LFSQFLPLLFTLVFFLIRLENLMAQAMDIFTSLGVEKFKLVEHLCLLRRQALLWFAYTDLPTKPSQPDND